MDDAAALPVARDSRKLVATVITLVALPLLLPFPSAFLALKWILPVIVKEWSQCPAYCPPSTDGERLEWLLILGPSMLLAAVSIIFGTIGLIRVRQHPASPKKVNWFKISMGLGIIWLLISACLYGVIFEVTGIVP